MAREPLASFATRIVRNDEVQEFIDALVEAGVPLTKLISAVNNHRYTIVGPIKQEKHNGDRRPFEGLIRHN